MIALPQSITESVHAGFFKHYKTYKLRKGMLFKYLSAWWWNYVCLKGGIAKFALWK